MIDLAIIEFGATVEHLQGGARAAPSPHLRIPEESHGSPGCQCPSFFPGSQALPGLLPGMCSFKCILSNG